MSCATLAAEWRRAATAARCSRTSGTARRCTGRTRKRRFTRCGTRSPCRCWCCAPGRRSCLGSGPSCPLRRRSDSRPRRHRHTSWRSTRLTTRSRRTTIPSPPSVLSCARAYAPGRSRPGGRWTGGSLLAPVTSSWSSWPTMLLARPARAVTVGGDRSAQIVYSQGDEAELRSDGHLLSGSVGGCLAGVDRLSLLATTDHQARCLAGWAWWLDHARNDLSDPCP
jgi:hypothetical protein